MPPRTLALTDQAQRRERVVYCDLWQAGSVTAATGEDPFIKQFLSACENGSWADADVTKPDAVDSGLPVSVMSADVLHYF